MAGESLRVAADHPDHVAAQAEEQKHMDVVKSDPKNEDAIAKYRAASDNSMKVFGQKTAEHFGSSIDNYIAGTAERERSERVAKATRSANEEPIVKKPNGKFVLGCRKCEGSGFIPFHSNYDDGRCFDCRGRGFHPDSEEFGSKEELRSIVLNNYVSKAQEDPKPRQPQAASPAPAPAAPVEKPKGFANKYAGKCVGCNTRVGVGEGLTSRGATGWEVRCVGCHHG
jgi:hypothetical protein